MKYDIDRGVHEPLHLAPSALIFTLGIMIGFYTAFIMIMRVI